MALALLAIMAPAALADETFQEVFVQFRTGYDIEAVERFDGGLNLLTWDDLLYDDDLVDVEFTTLQLGEGADGEALKVTATVLNLADVGALKVERSGTGGIDVTVTVVDGTVVCNVISGAYADVAITLEFTPPLQAEYWHLWVNVTAHTSAWLDMEPICAEASDGEFIYPSAVYVSSERPVDGLYETVGYWGLWPPIWSGPICNVTIHLDDMVAAPGDTWNITFKASPVLLIRVDRLGFGEGRALLVKSSMAMGPLCGVWSNPEVYNESLIDVSASGNTVQTTGMAGTGNLYYINRVWGDIKYLLPVGRDTLWSYPASYTMYVYYLAVADTNNTSLLEQFFPDTWYEWQYIEYPVIHVDLKYPTTPEPYGLRIELEDGTPLTFYVDEWPSRILIRLPGKWYNLDWKVIRAWYWTGSPPPNYGDSSLLGATIYDGWHAVVGKPGEELRVVERRVVRRVTEAAIDPAILALLALLAVLAALLAVMAAVAVTRGKRRGGPVLEIG
mgnify:CR=1 FL=1